MKTYQSLLLTLTLCCLGQVYAKGSKIPLALNAPVAEPAKIKKVFSRINSFYAAAPSYIAPELLKDCRDLTVQYYSARDNPDGIPSVYFRQTRRPVTSDGRVDISLGIKGERSNENGTVVTKPLYYLFKNEASNLDHLVYVSNKWEQNYWTQQMVPVESSYVFIQIMPNGEIRSIRHGMDQAYYRLNKKLPLIVEAPFLAAVILNPFSLPFVGLELSQSADLKCGKMQN